MPQSYPETPKRENTRKKKNNNTCKEEDRERHLEGRTDKGRQRTHPHPADSLRLDSTTKPYRFQHKMGCTSHSY